MNISIRINHYSVLVFVAIISSCSTVSSDGNNTSSSQEILSTNELTKINKLGNKISSRFTPPKNFTRLDVEENSFAEYLRNLPLKPDGSLVTYYDGTIKSSGHVFDAVVDLPIGKKNLHQCADAVMRLKAEYHWQQKDYDKIHFNFTNGDRINYSNWMTGQRIKIDGNKSSWYQAKEPSNSGKDFWEYLEIIFTYAGTASLSKELLSVPIMEMQIGDIFIIGGHPGHAVLVVDMAINKTSGEKIYLLGQSYMPAQEFQILKNNNEENISPWYSLIESDPIKTPEWVFSKNDLRRFKE